MKEAGPGDLITDAIGGEMLELAEDISGNRPQSAKASAQFLALLILPVVSLLMNPFIMMLFSPQLGPRLFGGEELPYVWPFTILSTVVAVIGFLLSVKHDDPRKPLWIPRLGSLAALAMDGLAILMFSMMP